MSEYLYAGLTSQTVDIFLQDSSSTTGAGLSGLVFNSAGLVASYRKGATGSRTAITLATQTVGGAWSSGGFVEIEATHMKGVYRFDVPNVAIDAEGFITLYFYGATNLLSTSMRIDCRALPSDVKKLLGTAWLAPAVAGTPDVNTKSLTAGAIVAASLAASALNGKGDWLLSSGYTAPANSTIALIYAVLQLTDASVATMSTDTRNAILNRVLAGNHDTAGTVGKLLQNLDVLLSTRSTPAEVTAALDAISATALARFATVNTGQVAAAAGSVALLSQGSGGGGAGDASQTTLLAVQALAVAIAAALAGGPVNAVGRVATGGRLIVFVGDDWRTAQATVQTIPVSDPTGALYTKLSAIGTANLRFGASRGSLAAGIITGTVSGLSQATISSVLHCLISIEMTAAGVGLPPSDDYEYQVQQRIVSGAETLEFVEITGPLSLRARRVAT